MTRPVASFRLTAATAVHRGDRQYQQDRVAVVQHHQVPSCMLAIVADGMGGKSGGRKAADQVLMTGRQVFDRYSPSEDDPGLMLRQMVLEAHLMIKLTAISAEEEPHSTIAAFVINPTLECAIAHAGDSRVYHFRNNEMLARTKDHSFVQRLVDEGKIAPEDAMTHPQANLLTGCLGTEQEPVVSMAHIDRLQSGDTMLACSDGLWHYFSDKELAAIVHALSPREAAEMMVTKARQRARGGGDNLSLAIGRIDEL